MLSTRLLPRSGIQKPLISLTLQHSIVQVYPRPPNAEQSEQDRVDAANQLLSGSWEDALMSPFEPIESRSEVMISDVSIQQPSIPMSSNTTIGTAAAQIQNAPESERIKELTLQFEIAKLQAATAQSRVRELELLEVSRAHSIPLERSIHSTESLKSERVFTESSRSAESPTTSQAASVGCSKTPNSDPLFHANGPELDEVYCAIIHPVPFTLLNIDNPLLRTEVFNRLQSLKHDEVAFRTAILFKKLELVGDKGNLIDGQKPTGETKEVGQASSTTSKKPAMEIDPAQKNQGTQKEHELADDSVVEGITPLKRISGEELHQGFPFKMPDVRTAYDFLPAQIKDIGIYNVQKSAGNKVSIEWKVAGYEKSFVEGKNLIEATKKMFDIALKLGIVVIDKEMEPYVDLTEQGVLPKEFPMTVANNKPRILDPRLSSFLQPFVGSVTKTRYTRLCIPGVPTLIFTGRVNDRAVIENVMKELIERKLIEVERLLS